jgi:putative ABC transport system permease protein
MRWIGQDDNDWENNSTHNYVLLKPHTSIAALNARVATIYKQHVTDATAHAFLYPVSQLHLYGSFDKNGLPDGGKMDAVRVFIAIALLILLIACINFMNMSTARSEKRAKEVGIRKVSGALRGSLIGQFLGESILLTASDPAGLTRGLVVDAPVAGRLYLSCCYFRLDLSFGGYGRVIDRAVYGELSGDQGRVGKSRNEFAF